MTAGGGDSVVEVDLEGMAHGGAAFGRAADGRVVFVGGGLPGESAAVALTDVHERFAHGILSALPDPPSPDRLAGAAPCPHFGAWPARGRSPAGACGGCQWQHVRYDAQLRFKADVLRDTLRRIGGIADPPVRPTLGMPDPWRYRNQIRVRSGPAGLGFVAADDHTVVAIDACPIAHPAVDALRAALDADLPPGTEVTLRAGLATGDRMIVFHAPEDAVDWIEVEIDASVVLARPDGRVDVAAGRPFLVEAVEDHIFVIPPTGFFQVNTAMAAVLVEQVRQACPAHGGTLIDLYSGVGLFAVRLAERFREVFAVEDNPASVAAAVDNAAGLDHVTLLEADAAEGLAHLALGADVVVADPPRAGLSADVVRLLKQHPPDTIIYVSCEPSTLARDVRQLVSGGWSLVGCQPVDMFPQTYHVESVSVLRRA